MSFLHAINTKKMTSLSVLMPLPQPFHGQNTSHSRSFINLKQLWIN